MPDHVQSLKEVARHLLYRAGGARALQFFKRARGLPSRHLRRGDLGDRFAAIHRDRVWSIDSSVSGPGSDPNATSGIRLALAELLRELGAKQVTDVGCGDFGWMQGVEGDFRYCGVDIVPELIDELNARRGGATRRFLCLDATRDPLPEGDAAICREVLFHLSLADGFALLRNLAGRGYLWLIATCDAEIWFNADIPSGDYRPLNLTAGPFRFPPPLRAIRDDRVVPGRILGAWRFCDIGSLARTSTRR